MKLCQTLRAATNDVKVEAMLASGKVVTPWQSRTSHAAILSAALDVGRHQKYCDTIWQGIAAELALPRFGNKTEYRIRAAVLVRREPARENDTGALSRLIDKVLPRRVHGRIEPANKMPSKAPLRVTELRLLAAFGETRALCATFRKRSRQARPQWNS